jgi:hypothetical protein
MGLGRIIDRGAKSVKAKADAQSAHPRRLILRDDAARRSRFADQ